MISIRSNATHGSNKSRFSRTNYARVVVARSGQSAVLSSGWAKCYDNGMLACQPRSHFSPPASAIGLFGWLKKRKVAVISARSFATPFREHSLGAQKPEDEDHG